MEARSVIKEPWVVGIAAKPLLGHDKGERAEDGDQEVARIPKGIRKASWPVRDIKAFQRAPQLHPRKASSTPTPTRRYLHREGVLGSLKQQSTTPLSDLPTAAPFVVPESFWCWEGEPYPCALAYRSLPYSQRQQPFVGNSQQSAAATGGAGNYM